MDKSVLLTLATLSAAGALSFLVGTWRRQKRRLLVLLIPPAVIGSFAGIVLHWPSAVQWALFAVWAPALVFYNGVIPLLAQIKEDRASRAKTKQR